MTFTGIPVAALDFYEDLEADNSKSFWTAHKHIYEESVRTPLEALAAELEPEFGSAAFAGTVAARAAVEPATRNSRRDGFFSDICNV